MDGIVYLDPTGKRLRDEAVANLQAAMRDIMNCMNALEQNKGIGAEFCIEKLEELYSSISSMKSAFNKL